MAKLTTRSLTTTTVTADNKPKGSALTHSELDSNFLNLETDKLENTTDDFTGTLSIKGSGGSAVGVIRHFDNDDSNYIDIQAPGTVGTNYALTLPTADGSSGQVLTTDGSGNLSFTDKTALTGLNIDGFTDGTGITVAATDQMLISDGGTEKRINASQIDTYVSGTTATLTNKTLTTPVLSGAITTASNGDITFDPNGTGDVLITPTTPTGTAGPGFQFGWNSNSTGGAAHIKNVLSVDAGSDDPTTNLLFNEGIQITASSAGDGSTNGGYDSDFSWPTLAFLSNDKHGSLTSPNTDRNTQNQAYGNIWFVKQNKDATTTSQIAVESNQILGGFFGAGSHDSNSLAPTSAQMFIRATEDFTTSQNGTRMEFTATANGDTNPTPCLDITGDSVVINPDTQDVDFQVHSASNDNILKVDCGKEIVSTGGVFQLYAASSDPSSNLVEGQMYFNSSTKKFMGYNGTAWVVIGTQS